MIICAGPLRRRITIKIRGSVTEVVYDFVVTPPQATIGLQRSDFPDVRGHWCTVLFTFCLCTRDYVTTPLATSSTITMQSRGITELLQDSYVRASPRSVPTTVRPSLFHWNSEKVISQLSFVDKTHTSSAKDRLRTLGYVMCTGNVPRRSYCDVHRATCLWARLPSIFFQSATS